MPYFDPAEFDKALAEMTPHEFGILVARMIVERPSSQNQIIVGQVIKAKTGWDPSSSDEIVALVERIASETI